MTGVKEAAAASGLNRDLHWRLGLMMLLLLLLLLLLGELMPTAEPSRKQP